MWTCQEGKAEYKERPTLFCQGGRGEDIFRQMLVGGVASWREPVILQSAYIASQPQVGLCDVAQPPWLWEGCVILQGWGTGRVGPGRSYMLLFEMGRDCFSLDPVPELNKWQKLVKAFSVSLYSICGGGRTVLAPALLGSGENQPWFITGLFSWVIFFF